jgi:hypothetical protein
MKNIFLLVLVILSHCGFGQNIKVELVGEAKLRKASQSTRAAWKYLAGKKNIVAEYVPVKKLKHAGKFKNRDVIWFHLPDTCCDKETIPAQSVDNIYSYVSGGGNLLLTRAAFRLVNTLGIEPDIVEKTDKEAADSGYGRMLGYHAFLWHPVFDGLNGGAYVLKPSADIELKQYGFFGDALPATGKIVAVDWDYIFLREKKKIILEYGLNKGKILAVGGYVNFEYPSKENAVNGEVYNVNRRPLEKFVSNCLSHVTT